MSDRKIGDATVIQVLRQTGGVMAAAARHLDVDRSTLYDWINENPVLSKALSEIREETIDLAESQLLRAINEGSEKSVHFYLRTIGRTRGYFWNPNGEDSSATTIVIKGGLPK